MKSVKKIFLAALVWMLVLPVVASERKPVSSMQVFRHALGLACKRPWHAVAWLGLAGIGSVAQALDKTGYTTNCSRHPMWLLEYPFCAYIALGVFDRLHKKYRGFVQRSFEEAVINGSSFETVKAWLKKKPNLHKLIDGSPILLTALMSYPTEVEVYNLMRLLLQEGAQRQDHGEYEDVELHCAALLNYANVVRLLLQDKYKEQEEVVIDNAYVQAYIQEVCKQNGITLLLHAIRTNNLPLVTLLVRRTLVDVNEQDEQGRTALRHAVELRHATIVGQLLVFGARHDIPDMKGTTCLMRAAELDDLIITKMLMTAGANVYERDDDGLDTSDRVLNKIHAGIPMEVAELFPWLPCKYPTHTFQCYGELINFYLEQFEQRERQLMQEFFSLAHVDQEKWNAHVRTVKPLIKCKLRYEQSSKIKKGRLMDQQHNPVYSCMAQKLEKFALKKDIKIFLEKTGRNMAMSADGESIFVAPETMIAPESFIKEATAHEVQHILFDDFVVGFCMRMLLPSENNAAFYRAWSYFQEERADTFAVLTDIDMCRQAYVNSSITCRDYCSRPGINDEHPHNLVRAAYFGIAFDRMCRVARNGTECASDS